MENEYWEYMFVRTTIAGRVLDSAGKSIDDLLNKLGKESWEAYSVFETRDREGRVEIQYCLKRRMDPTSLLGL